MFLAAIGCRGLRVESACMGLMVVLLPSHDLILGALFFLVRLCGDKQLFFGRLAMQWTGLMQ